MLERRLLFFGDSFVAGMGDPEGRGWVGRVAAAAAAAGVWVTPYNLGVRGETSVEVAERWWGEAEPRLVAGADCRLVVSFGANDAAERRPEASVPLRDLGRSPRTPRRVEEAVSVMALESMLVTAAELGIGAFVVGPGPLGDAEGDRRVLALDEAFAVRCEELDVPYVPVARALIDSATWTGETRRSDGTHPGAGGYTALARLVLDGGFLDWLSE